MARVADSLFVGFSIQPEWDLSKPLHEDNIHVDVVLSRQFHQFPEFKAVVEDLVEIVKVRICAPHILQLRNKLASIPSLPLPVRHIRVAAGSQVAALHTPSTTQATNRSPRNHNSPTASHRSTQPPTSQRTSTQHDLPSPRPSFDTSCPRTSSSTGKTVLSGSSNSSDATIIGTQNLRGTAAHHVDDANVHAALNRASTSAAHAQAAANLSVSREHATAAAVTHAINNLNLANNSEDSLSDDSEDYSVATSWVSSDDGHNSLDSSLYIEGHPTENWIHTPEGSPQVHISTLSGNLDSDPPGYSESYTSPNANLFSFAPIISDFLDQLSVSQHGQAMVAQALEYEPGSWISLFVAAGLGPDQASILRDIVLDNISSENRSLYTAVV